MLEGGNIFYASLPGVNFELIAQVKTFSIEIGEARILFYFFFKCAPFYVFRI